MELVECDAPLAKTKNFYRFLIEVKGNALTKFKINERKEHVCKKTIFHENTS
jgi:hypothetical protein